MGTFLRTTSYASYENMHVLLMKFLYLFLLPEINITSFFSFLDGGGGGEAGVTSNHLS